MPEFSLDHRTGGAALAVGYALLVAALFRDPASGLSTATASPQGVVFFLALPVVGLASGVYAYAGGPYRTALALVTATYLATVGVAVALFLTGGAVLVVFGGTLFALAAVALLGSLLDALASLGLDGTMLS